MGKVYTTDLGGWESVAKPTGFSSRSTSDIDYAGWLGERSMSDPFVHQLLKSGSLVLKSVLFDQTTSVSLCCERRM